MRIDIRNNAQLKKKDLRFIKWKLYSLKEKFQDLIYTNVFINSEGQSPKIYIVNIRLGIPGHDIIIQNKSENLGELLQKTSQGIHRYLAKNKETNHRKNKSRKNHIYLPN